MPQGTNIVNIHADIPGCRRVEGDIDPKIFNYFFRKLLAGDRGPRQAFICFFYQKFYEACIAAGIEEKWDEENETKLMEVLNKLNFNVKPTRKSKS